LHSPITQFGWEFAEGNRLTARSFSSSARSLQELCPEDGRVNLGDHLVLGYLCIEVGKEPGNCARHLRAHLHCRDRIDRACGLHDLRNVALLHFRGVILHRRAAANRPEGGQ